MDNYYTARLKSIQNNLNNMNNNYVYNPVMQKEKKNIKNNSYQNFNHFRNN